LYIKSIEQETVPFEKEELTQTQQLNEYIMTSLRTKEGLSLQQVKEKWNENSVQKIMMQSQKFTQKQMMFEKNCHLILTRKGKLFADGIAADLFAS
jgi:oxygen-independent coproporphyrinogen-3 oxidase